MSLLYSYIKNQWILRRYSAEQIAICIVKNYITPAEAEEILALAQVAI